MSSTSSPVSSAWSSSGRGFELAETFRYEDIEAEYDDLERLLGSIFVPSDSLLAGLCGEVRAWLQRLFDVSVNLLCLRRRNADRARDARLDVKISLENILHMLKCIRGYDETDYRLAARCLSSAARVLEAEMALGEDSFYALPSLKEIVDLGRKADPTTPGAAEFLRIAERLLFDADTHSFVDFEESMARRFDKDDEIDRACLDVKEVLGNVKYMLEEMQYDCDSDSDDECEDDEENDCTLGEAGAVRREMRRGERIFSRVIALEEAKTPRRSLRLASKQRSEFMR